MARGWRRVHKDHCFLGCFLCNFRGFSASAVQEQVGRQVCRQAGMQRGCACQRTQAARPTDLQIQRSQTGEGKTISSVCRAVCGGFSGCGALCYLCRARRLAAQMRPPSSTSPAAAVCRLSSNSHCEVAVRLGLDKRSDTFGCCSLSSQGFPSCGGIYNAHKTILRESFETVRY